MGLSRRVLPADLSGSVVVHVPGSKSVANRALVCALLAEGESRLAGVPDGDDTTVIVNALDSTHRISRDGDVLVVRGDSPPSLPGIVDAKLAGTSSRFLTAVAALLGTTTVIDGDEPLRGRPMGDLHQALIELGAHVEWLGDRGHLPVAVSRGQLRGGSISIRGDVSSQFISALMLIAPLLQGGLRLSIVGDLVSRSYVEMTAAVMRSFGVVVHVSEQEIHVPEGPYAPQNYRIEPDFSSAAFPLMAPVLTPCSVRIPGLSKGILQGDSAVLEILTSIGCSVSVMGDDVVVERSEGSVLRAIDVSMTDCSDLVPAVSVALSAVEGESRITGVGFIRHKESDRLGDLAAEMSKCGASVVVDADGLSIRGKSEFQSSVVETHHDHRLAMALSLYALRGIEIVVADADVVTKSWPTFFNDMAPILSSMNEQK